MTRERFWIWQQRYAPYFFVAPFVLLFVVFMLYPLGRSIILSFHKTAGPRNVKFVGWDNFVFLLQDRLFWLAVLNTIYYTIVFLALQIPLSLGLALLLNSKQVRWRNFFRFAFFSSHLVGQVFVGIIFARLLAPRHGFLTRGLGAIGDLLREVGLDTFLTADINPFANKWFAMPAVIVASLWLSVGYGMIYFLAALQNVDKELYEAAEVDGAGKWSQFWNVTLPGIRPVLVFLILFGTIGSLQLFELPYVMFQGAGPNYSVLTIVGYLFINGFEVGDIGYAAAIGWMLTLMIFVVSLIQLRVTHAARED